MEECRKCGTRGKAENFCGCCGETPAVEWRAMKAEFKRLVIQELAKLK